MLLAIDMGNTNITLGAYKDGELLFVSRLYTSRHKSGDEYAIDLLDIFGLYNVSPSDFSGCVFASVVPELTQALSTAVKRTVGIEPVIVGGENYGELRVDILPVSYLGADLIAGAVGAREKYPLPCLVCDLGTATKILVIDKDGIFRGCTISPGVKISMDALAKNAALLPSISFTTPEKAIGENTIECMQSGIVFGTAAMLDGMIKRIRQELGYEECTLVATGGYSTGIIPCCEEKLIYDENLLLDGLKAIYEKSRK
ncbi:MAG: type III pantothenate kinase [Clostridia bacterium]|nr:type III pantothenate kinase [Clostridia bacterium]